jgi:hypothetical protein
MKTYTVKSGENIFDISLKLFGSIEGIFDILVENSGLSFDGDLTSGMVLSYDEDFVINSNITSQLDEVDADVRNGQDYYRHTDIEDCVNEVIDAHNSQIVAQITELSKDIPTNAASILSLISKYHPTTLSGFETKMGYCDLVYNGTTSATDKESANTMRTAIEGMSYDEKQNEITTKQTPVILCIQSGNFASMALCASDDSVIAVDWGDDNTPDVYTGSDESIYPEHGYADDGTHYITVYGCTDYKLLDLSGISGSIYPMTTIRTNKLITADNKKYNLIITT